MLNQVLINTAKIIVDNGTPTTFNIDAVFTNSSPGATFNFSPLRIDDIALNKDYAGNFADEIFLSMTISPKDFALLQDQGQSLRCDLTFTYLDKFGNITFKKKPVKKSYNVFITNPKDMRKAYPDIQNYTEPSVNIILQLIEDSVYNLRMTKLNKIFTKTTLKSVIHDLVSNLGITKLHLIDPDNDHEWDHVEIESLMGIESLFVFLQTKYGVYIKGLNVYVSNGVCYIYPPFDTEIDYDKYFAIYKVSTGMYAGSINYHSELPTGINFVLNTEAKDYDLSIMGAENHGTGFLFPRASRMADGLTTIDSQTGAQFTENPSLKVTLNNPKTVIPGSNNLKIVKPTDNPYPHMAKLYSTQASLMQFNWSGADPFILDPCTQIQYYYDNDGKMMTKNGIQESASYRISRAHRAGDKDVFSCTGDMVVRLSLKEKQSIY